MSRRVAFVLTAALAWTIPSVHGQSEAKPSNIKRTPDGKPDLSGIWCRPGCGLELETDPSKTTPNTVVPGITIKERASYQPWAIEKIKTLKPSDSPSLKCLLPGVPAITGAPFPLEIVQTAEKIYILYETQHAFRIIPFSKEHPEGTDPTFLGDSIASWDGDTLVVDVTSFNDKTYIPGGSIHTEQLHVVERYHLQGDSILYSAMIQDAGALNKPYMVSLRLDRRPKTDRVNEYECNENNQNLPHIVAGGK